MRCLRTDLLVTALGAGADKEPNDLLDKPLLLPEGAYGVEEYLHLRGHGAIPRWEPEYQPVGLLQVFRFLDELDAKSHADTCILSSTSSESISSTCHRNRSGPIAREVEDNEVDDNTQQIKNKIE